MNPPAIGPVRTGTNERESIRAELDDFNVICLRFSAVSNENNMFHLIQFRKRKRSVSSRIKQLTKRSFAEWFGNLLVTHGMTEAPSSVVRGFAARVGSEIRVKRPPPGAPSWKNPLFAAFPSAGSQGGRH